MLNPPITGGIFVVRTIVAPNPAPPAIPSRYGSASGFLNMPWYVAPANAKDPPTRPDVTTLGNLMSQIIVFQLVGVVSNNSINGSFDKIICRVAIGGMKTEPIPAANIAITIETPKAINNRRQRCRDLLDTSVRE